MDQQKHSSVQLLSHVRLFATPWTAAHQASLSITNSQSLLELMSIESVMPSNHLLLCRSLLFLPSVFPSIRDFLHQVAKVLELQLQHQSFQQIFRVDFLYDGLVESPYSPRDSQESSPTLQFKSISSLVPSLIYRLISMHNYWEKTALTIHTFVGKVISLLFNTLSRLVVAFLPRSNSLGLW